MTILRSTCLASLFLVLGCGDDSVAGGAGGGGQGAGAQGGGATGGSGTGGIDVPDGCTLITQVGSDSVLFSMSGASFPFEPELDMAGPEVITVSPQSIGAVPLGSTEFNGMNGSVISFASVDAITDLINASPTDMDGRLFGATAGTVDIEQAPSYGTQFKGFISGTLSNVEYRELDDQLEVIDGGDCLFLAEGQFDEAAYEADCTAPVDIATTPSGGACMADWQTIGHDCNPVTNDGCAANEICDFGGYFKCYPVQGNEAGLCEACDYDGGPLCAVGTTCDADNDTGKCYRYCCTDDDCGAAGTCISYAYVIGIGICLTN